MIWELREPSLTVEGQVLMQEIGTYLIENGILAQTDAARAREAADASGEAIHVVASKLGMAAEDDLADAVAKFFQLNRVHREDFPSDAVQPDRFSEPFLRTARVLPVSESDTTITIAAADPMNETAVKSIALATEKRVDVMIAAPSDIDTGIEQLYARAKTDALSADGELGADDLETLAELAAEKPVIRYVNRMIEQAVELGASDIHLDPHDLDYVRRFRVDGILSEAELIPSGIRSGLVSRIKIMSALDIGERRLPQDGRITFATRGKPIDLRVAIIPTIEGESVVLRLLDPESMEFSLEALGFSDQAKRSYEDLIAQPHGIVLVTGPTGSGKTTSLYACLDKMNTGDRKILTVEDPVEYQLGGIQQVQVHSGIGLTFASALRSILRHDPDVLMVGEIRDLETAEIAIQFALTGHPVLSTLHTNDAVASITRLLDMGVDDYLISTAINGIVAQRLVRKLCPECKTPHPEAADIAARLTGNDYSKSNFCRPVGCPNCRQTGYSGRSAIVEVLPFSREVKSAILDGKTGSEIASMASELGVTTLLQDGIERAARGDTPIEEVLRVARLET